MAGMGSVKDQEVGATVARIRVERQLSQQAVAEGMRQRDPENKWSQATVWAVEKGDRALRVSELDDLAKVLQTGYMYLLVPSRAHAYIRDLIEHGRALSELGSELDHLLYRFTREAGSQRSRLTRAQSDPEVAEGQQGAARLKIEMAEAEIRGAIVDDLAQAIQAVVGKYEKRDLKHLFHG